jgi:hypothetical protein
MRGGHGKIGPVTDITRLLLEARRALAAELDADLAERGEILAQQR